jgi:hypothetical protein
MKSQEARPTILCHKQEYAEVEWGLGKPQSGFVW